MKKIVPLFILIIIRANAQTVDVNNPLNPESFFNPQELIENVLTQNECSQVNNFQASVFGDKNDLQNKSYGFFKRQTGSNFPFEEGIVLSTGSASFIGDSSFPLLSTNFAVNLTDNDLSEALDVPPTLISDASSIEFDFISQSDKISFKYIMSSEEYNGAFPCFFSDSFAFLLKNEDETEYTNIALLPNTNTPVSVTNVHQNIIGGCEARNEEYFAGYNLGDTNFNGRTIVLTAKADVIPNKKYHMKLVVADYSDSEFDTAIFLESGSFNIGLDLGESASISKNNAICGDEKLLTANVNAGSYKWFKDGTEIIGETAKDYLVNLGDGTYSCEINNGGCIAKDDVFLEFSPAPINNTNISDFLIFDDNSIINLNSKIDEILLAQDPNIYNVLFFSDQNLENIINNPDEYNATDNETIYIKVVNTLTSSNIIESKCSVNSSFIIRFIDFTPTSAIDYIVCDDISNDGIYDNFYLSSKDSEILGTSSSEYSVTYYTTQIGAQTKLISDLIAKDNPYTNNTANEQTIYVRVEDNIDPNIFFVSEESSIIFKPFKLIINPLPIVNDIFFTQCDSDTDLSTNTNLTLVQQNISNNNLNESFKYYTSEANAISDTSEITDASNYLASNGDIIWVRTTSAEQCYRISNITINIFSSGNISYNNEFKQCDDLLDFDGNNTANNDDEDGITFFDISSVVADVTNLYPVAIQNDIEVLIFETIADRNIVSNPIENLVNYRNKNLPAFTQQNLYIKVIDKNNNNCEDLGEFTILTEEIPKLTLQTTQILCLNNPPLILEVIYNNNYNYEWTKNGDTTNTLSSTYQLEVFEEGEYSITVSNNATDNLCEYTQTITVIASSTANIDMSAISIVDDSNNNSITIDPTNLGDGDYLYALFSETETVRGYQTEPYFDNLEGGIYTVVIKDTYNCGLPAEIQVSIVAFPNFFTPNNDGFNDTWCVKGVNTTFYPNSSVNIFDRYGNKVAEIDTEGEGWDGLYNGKPLPSNDYWYTTHLIDSNGNVRSKKGHFSLLRK